MAAPSILDYVATPAQAGTLGVNPQTYTVTLPAYSAGDLVVIHLVIDAGDLDHPGTPFGWTLRSGWTVSGGGVAVQTATFTRIMDGSEGTTVTFSKATGIQYNWKAVASSWQHVDGTTPVGVASNNTSGGGVNSATWTLGTLTGGFTGGASESWGGEYLKLNSDDGVSFTEIGTLTVELDASTVDITTAFAADYDVLDTSGHLVGSSPFRLILVRQATAPGSGARIWARF